MSLSAALQQRYSTEVDVDWRVAFGLFHPSAGEVFLIDAPEEAEKNMAGARRLFKPVPAQVVPAARDDSGREDVGIVWCGITAEARDYVERAMLMPEHAIRCLYTVYLDGDPAPHIDPPVELALGNVTISETSSSGATVAAVATRADILNRSFPAEVYKVQHYPGLRRR